MKLLEIKIFTESDIEFLVGLPFIWKYEKDLFFNIFMLILFNRVLFGFGFYVNKIEKEIELVIGPIYMRMEW